MQFNNIKDYALNFIKNLDQENFNLLTETIKQLKLEICNFYSNKPDVIKVLKKYNLCDTGLYLEMIFIDIFIKTNISTENKFTIKKITEKDTKTVDFIIMNKLGEPKGLFECTTFNLSYNNAIRINNSLKEVLIDQERGLLPRFELPNDYLTTFLGSDSLTDKVRDKCLQFDTFISNNWAYQSVEKFIIFDLTWYVFDNRVSSNSMLTNVIDEWKIIYQTGKDRRYEWFERYLRNCVDKALKLLVLASLNDFKKTLELLSIIYMTSKVSLAKQDNLINVLKTLCDILSKNALKLILIINNKDLNSLMVFNQNEIYVSTWENLICGISSRTEKNVLNFNEYIIFGKCENLLFNTERQGNVTCMRYVMFTYAFLHDFITKKIMNKIINESTWKIKLIKEIEYYENILYKYESIKGEKHILEKYENILTMDRPALLNIVDLFHTLHYLVERLYSRMKNHQLIGRNDIASQTKLQISPNESDIDIILHTGINEKDLWKKYWQVIEDLNVKEFNEVWENMNDQLFSLNV